MLEIIVSILYLFNKLLLYLKKRSAWAIGILASSIATVYFFSIELYIFFSLEIACVIIMAYGYFRKDANRIFEWIVYGSIILVMLYLLINIEESGPLEFATSISFIIAFLLLAEGKWNIGWTMLGLSHGAMLYITLIKGQQFFAAMQGLSILICTIAILQGEQSRKKLDVA